MGPWLGLEGSICAGLDVSGIGLMDLCIEAVTYMYYSLIQHSYIQNSLLFLKKFQPAAAASASGAAGTLTRAHAAAASPAVVANRARKGKS